MFRQIFSSALLVIGCLLDLERTAQAEPIADRRIEKSVSGDLSLDRALGIALKQNPDVRKALQDIERTKGQVI